MKTDGTIRGIGAVSVLSFSGGMKLGLCVSKINVSLK